MQEEQKVLKSNPPWDKMSCGHYIDKSGIIAKKLGHNIYIPDLCKEHNFPIPPDAIYGFWCSICGKFTPAEEPIMNN